MLPGQGQPPSRLTGASALNEPLFPGAWQPLTPAGVAAFAFSSLRRLVVAQWVVAAVAVAAFLVLLHQAILPVLREAVDQLPDQGIIVNRTLSSPLTNTTVLAQSSHLVVVVDLPGTAMEGLRSDFHLWFRKRELAVCSVFGCLALRYPQNWTVAFNRKEVAPAIEAWMPVANAVVASSFLVLLLVSWIFLATAFFPIPMLVARYSDRALPWRASWKLSGAALMPGALLATLGLALYGLGWMSLITWIAVGVLHFMVGWLYLVLAPLSLPKRSEVENMQNPFSADEDSSPENAAPQSKNPFSSSQD